MIESQRLYEIRMKQSTIRGEVLQGIEEAMRRGDDEASSIGTRIILLSSFTGGRRYMFNRCQDVMAIYKHFGYPYLFLTITCNPNWPEFQRFTERDRIPITDRPDISCRVFHAKLKCLVSNLKEARLRSEKKIVINVASSGIASLLLPGGKTAHSIFNIPVELTEDIVCRIKKDSPKAELFPELGIEMVLRFYFVMKD
ncbi:hypothetical protein AHAS_Ahas08G0073800 [Arachis hypogaea]